MFEKPPRWQELLARFLQRSDEALELGEVEPYQAQPALGLDLATAWQDALLPGTTLGEPDPTRAYPDAWQQIRYYQWEAPFPCCVGLAPQFLQHIRLLMQDTQQFFQSVPKLQGSSLADSPPEDEPWLVRLALARSSGDFTMVDAVLGEPEDRGIVVRNERAAQDWLRGNRAAAARIWDSLPQDHAVIVFNQGLAAISRGDLDRGRRDLASASSGFAETTGWRHLADLYRTALVV